MQTFLARKGKKVSGTIVFVPAFCLLASVLLFRYNHPAFYPFVFGFVFGFIMQRSRFCFAACFRDIFLLRSTVLTRALIVVLIITSAGFMAAQLFLGYDLAVLGKVYPVGLHTLTGGFLFGVGMVVAGACVSGCLVKKLNKKILAIGTI